MNAKKVLTILGFGLISIHFLGLLPAYQDMGINGLGIGFIISAAIVHFMEKKAQKM